MKWYRIVCVLAALVLAVTAGPAHAAIEFVPVGNAGNAADDTGYGAVGYNYRISKYEVTADQWAAALAADSNVGNAGSWSGSQPTGGTSWYEAAKFCNWLTTGSANSGVYNTSTWAIMDRQTAMATFGTAYFIPTENEWYKAAYYDPNKSGAGVGGYWDYPTKHDSPNVPDGIDFAGDPAFDAVLDGYFQSQPNSVDNAGVLSAYGTMGQGGNVWEWNERAIGSSRGMRGGDWILWSDFLLASSRSNSGPTTEWNRIGFRVASNEVIPEPASIAVWLGLCVTGMLWWRRRK